MRYFLFILLLILNISASVPRFSKKAPKVESGFVVPYQKHIMEVSGDRWVDRASQIWCESGFDPKAVSYVGAQGLGQFMPKTWPEWSPKGSDPFDPIQNIKAQHKFMLNLEMRCKYEMDAAIASYNCGLGNVRKAQRLAITLGLNHTGAWKITLPRITGKFSKETLDYVIRNKERKYIIKDMLNKIKK